ncbi:MAG: presenilin family intramembrane aspartyl protease [Candidatus Bathyarchaeia archaeon]
MAEGFKASLIHLTPVLASLLFGVFCAYVLLASSAPAYSVAPFPEDAVGAVGNAFYFVVLVAAGAFLMLLLFRRRNRKFIAVFIGFALSTAVFVLSLIYLSALSMLFGPVQIEVLILASVFLTALAVYIIFGTRSRIGDFIVLFFGGAFGAFLGVSVQTLSAVLTLCFLAVYDVFSVFRGPVGKIASIGLEHFRGLGFSFRDVQMGLGDLTFYSMLVGHMLFNFGFLSCLASLVGVLAGCFMAFKMLERRGVFPGLPLPVFFGLASGFIVLMF